MLFPVRAIFTIELVRLHFQVRLTKTFHVCLISCYFVVQGSRQVVQKRVPTPESPDNSTKHVSDEDETHTTSAKKKPSSGKDRVCISNYCQVLPILSCVCLDTDVLLFCAILLLFWNWKLFLVDQFFQLIISIKANSGYSKFVSNYHLLQHVQC